MVLRFEIFWSCYKFAETMRRGWYYTTVALMFGIQFQYIELTEVWVTHHYSLVPNNRLPKRVQLTSKKVPCLLDYTQLSACEEGYFSLISAIGECLAVRCCLCRARHWRRCCPCRGRHCRRCCPNRVEIDWNKVRFKAAQSVRER